MQKYWIFLLFILQLLFGSALCAEEQELTCGRLAPKNQKGDQVRHYAPDRLVDVLHLKIEVTPDYKLRKVSGTTSILFTPIGIPLQELSLHAVDLQVSHVESDVPIRNFQVVEGEIIVTFVQLIEPGAQVTVSVTYEAEPKQGLYFRTPEMGYLPEDMHIWTQGEMHEARHWFPSIDYPHEKFTSEVICHVPQEMTVLSNGRWISETFNEKTQLKAVRWLQEKPHVNYLIALVAGYFKKIEAPDQRVPLAFYTPSSQIDFAKNSFQDTADMMLFFEKELGIPYPWSKYDQAVVDDFTWGGMENTTLTILTDRTLFPDEFENVRSSQGLVAHELIHQWFGDYITCKDWSHIWLNEGFATYYAQLYAEYKDGQEEMNYGLYHQAKRIFQEKDDIIPIVTNRLQDMGQIFSFRPYQKGGWVLHMLRSWFGPEMYRRCIHEYLKRYPFQNARTQDLMDIFEEFTGRSLQQFADQWLYHSGYPQLELKYQWDEKTKIAKISIAQTHSVNEHILLFNLSAKLRFFTPVGNIDFPVLISQKQQEFEVELPEKPTYVRFDPDHSLLAQVTFKKPEEMLYVQLENAEDMIGQIVAIEALKSRPHQRVVQALQKVLQTAPFYGVRVEASKALQEIHSKEAFYALANSTEQPDARVRLQVVKSLGAFYRPEGYFYLDRILKQEKNPAILAEAIRSLGKYPEEGVQKWLKIFIYTPSYKNVIAEATLEAMYVQDRPEYLEFLKTFREMQERPLLTSTQVRLFKTMGYLARHQDETQEEVYLLLLKEITHLKQQVQIAVLEALGLLNYSKAIPILESFLSGAPGNPLRYTAENSLKKLRQEHSEFSQLDEVRKKLQQIQEDYEKLRNEFEQKKKAQ